ncbi:MAG: hypothetical protein KAU94_04695, partial [Verrucomicrobia bacterium]|nr:hypothetical protein [Verrucomicrobiota bacterium]
TCTGWTGTGSVPASGATANTGAIVLNDPDSTITWNWDADYRVNVVASGNGTVAAESFWSSTNLYNGFVPAGTTLDLETIPNSGWLFTGWSGDLAGDYTASNATLTVDAPINVTAHFSDDADDDGLMNSEEVALGTNPRNEDTDGDGENDGDEVAAGTDPLLNYKDIISNAGLVFQQVAFADGDTLADVVRLRGHLGGSHLDMVQNATLTTPLGVYAYEDSGTEWNVRDIIMSIEEFDSLMVGSTCLLDVTFTDSSTMQYAIPVPSDAELPMPQVPNINISGMDGKGYVNPAEEIVVSWEPWADALPSGGISVWIEVDEMDEALGYWLDSSSTNVVIPAGTFPESPHGSVFINFRNNGEGTTQNGTSLVVNKESGADVIFHTMDMSALHPDFVVEQWDILDIQPSYVSGDAIELAFSFGIATNSEQVGTIPLKIILSLDQQFDRSDYVFMEANAGESWIEGSTRDPDPPVFEIPVGIALGDYYFGIILDEDEQFGDPVRSNNVGWASDLVRVRLPVAADLDGDGLPDAWESLFFFNSVAAIAEDDSDGDGQSNLDEYIAGMDPTNAASCFAVEPVKNVPEGYVVKWTAVADRIYDVLWTPDLARGFQILETGIAHPVDSYTDTVHSARSSGYYMVAVRLPGNGDADGDGLSDTWESSYFSSSVAAVAGYDFDGDGQDNMHEYIAGTDPTNAASIFKVSSSSVDLDGSRYNVVMWVSVTNRVYSILWAPGLGQSFNVLEPEIPYPQSSYTDTVHGVEDSGFYKVDVKLDNYRSGG